MSIEKESFSILYKKGDHEMETYETTMTLRPFNNPNQREEMKWEHLFEQIKSFWTQLEGIKISIQCMNNKGREHGRVYKGDHEYMVILHTHTVYTFFHEVAHIIRWEEQQTPHHHDFKFNDVWKKLMKQYFSLMV